MQCSTQCSSAEASRVHTPSTIAAGMCRITLQMQVAANLQGRVGTSEEQSVYLSCFNLTMKSSERRMTEKVGYSFAQGKPYILFAEKMPILPWILCSHLTRRQNNPGRQVSRGGHQDGNSRIGRPDMTQSSNSSLAPKNKIDL